jgi:hypothetical protein
MSSVEPPQPVGPEPYTPTIIPNYVLTGTGSISRAPQNTLENVSRDAYETRLNVAAIDEPIRIVFGRVALGASLARALKYGNNALIILLWCRGEIDAIESITMGGVALPSGATVTHYTGTASQTVNASMVTAFASIGVTWTDALTGLAYSVVNLPPTDSSGTLVSIGDFIATVRGLKCYDPRDGAQSYASPATWLYTTNPTLHTARLLYDDTLGLGMTPTAEFWADVTTNANNNDVALSGGEKTRELNLAIEAQQPAESWIKAMGEYAGCFVVPEGSVYRLIPDAIGSSVATIVTDDIVDGSFSWGKKTQRNRPNLVFVRYTDGVGGVPSIAPRGSDIPALPSGEKRRGTVVPMPGIIKYSQALRYSIERRNHLYLEDLELEQTIFDRGLALQMGDIITVTYGALFASKLMRIMSIAFVSVGRWRLKLDEYDPASYSTLVQTAPTYVDSGLALPTAPPTVASLTLTEEAVSVAAGALPLSKIRATWPGVSYPFFLGYKVVIKNAAGVTVDEGTTTGTSYLSAALNAFTTYTVTVQVYSSVAIGATMTGTITLVSLGIDSLATVWSQAFSGDLYYTWFLDGIENYKLWPGDKALRLRTLAAAEHPETSVYTGANQLTPGRATQLLDDLEFGPFGVTPYSWRAISPVFNIGASRAAVFALYNLVKWINLYDAACECEFQVSEFSGMTPYTTDFGWKSLQTGRYVQLTFRPKKRKLTSTTHMKYFWALEFDPGGLAALMPTVTDTLPATSSASAGVTLTLPRKYIVVTSIQITPLSITSAAASYSNLTLSETLDNTMMLHCYDNTGARIAVPCSIAITGVPAE